MPHKDEELKSSEEDETEEEVFSIEENIRVLPLPTALEREIRIHKGCKSLGENFDVKLLLRCHIRTLNKEGAPRHPRKSLNIVDG